MDSSQRSLRPFKLSDVDDFLKWAKALTYLEKVAIPHPWRRFICLDNRSIGYVSIRPESHDDRCRAHISYAVGMDYWGQGIVTTALKIAVSKVFKEFPDLVRIEATVEVENKGSQKVLEKAGFLKEGLLRKYGFCKGEIRDMFIYSFLVTDSLL
ncbi:hypothetical protein ACB092_02G012800 [Castanea dentata]